MYLVCYPPTPYPIAPSSEINATLKARNNLLEAAMIMLMCLTPGVLITSDDDSGVPLQEHLGRQYSSAVVISLLIYKEVLK